MTIKCSCGYPHQFKDRQSWKQHTLIHQPSLSDRNIDRDKQIAEWKQKHQLMEIKYDK